MSREFNQTGHSLLLFPGDTPSVFIAHLKRHLGFRWLRLRAITGATDEFLVAATVQNLRKLGRFRADRAPIPINCPA